MDYHFYDEPQEVVLTYRQEDQAQPVQFRYERELPERMRRELEAEAAPQAVPVPAWRAATAPPEKRRRPWVARLFVGVSLLVALVCLGLGIFMVQQSRGAPGGSSNHGSSQPPDSDYYWYEEDLSDAETTIDTYRPFGGSAAHLELFSVAEDAQPLTAGQVYEKLRPSTVTVLGEQTSSYSVGTGIIFSSDGYILTNYHVIAGSSACQVWVTDQYGVDQEYEALLVGGDADQDLAVLKIDAQDLTAAQFGVSDDLRVGDKVYAIGNPLGLELRGTFTDGIVSAVNRDVDVDGVTMTLIQTNAALNSGNSGGPLVNEYGQVVGVNTIKMMSGYDTIEGLGFAIPTSLAVRWVNEIIETGRIEPQPVLGLSISRIPETLPDGTTGLEIISVTPGLGGDRAGIQEGDYVVAFAGQSVSRTEDILALRRGLHVGDQVSIRIYRDGEYLDLTMEMLAEESASQAEAPGSGEPDTDPDEAGIDPR